MDWSSLKDEAARMLLEKDALHIYAALLIQLVAAKLTGKSLGDAVRGSGSSRSNSSTKCSIWVAGWSPRCGRGRWSVASTTSSTR